MPDIDTHGVYQRPLQHPTEKGETVPVKEYPYEDGDVLVLGPEVFISADLSVISYRGENYYLRETKGP